MNQQPERLPAGPAIFVCFVVALLMWAAIIWLAITLWQARRAPVTVKGKGVVTDGLTFRNNPYEPLDFTNYMIYKWGTNWPSDKVTNEASPSPRF